MAFVNVVTTSGKLPARSSNIVRARRVAPLCLSAPTATISRSASIAPAPVPSTLYQPVNAGSHDPAPPCAAGPSRILVWFHSDLRLDDNLALSTAAKRARAVPTGTVVPMLALPRNHPAASSRVRGAASELKAALQRRGSDLVVTRERDVAGAILRACRAAKVEAVYFNHAVAAAEDVAAQRAVVRALEEAGVATEGFWSNTLIAPEEMGGSASKDLSLVRATKRAMKEVRIAEPVDAPDALPAIPEGLPSDELEARVGQGESAAQKLLDGISERTEVLAMSRSPDVAFTIKPMLDVGTVSPRRVYQRIVKALGKARGYTMSELVWRSYRCAVLYRESATSRKTAVAV